MDILLVGGWPLMGDDKIYGAMDEQDRECVKEAAMGCLKEIQSGKIVAERLTNSDVKQFGQKMVDEHSKANPKLNRLLPRR